jgi:hypothetical protein
MSEIEVRATTNEKVLVAVDAQEPGFYSVGKLARKLSGASAKDGTTKKMERAIRLLVANGSLVLQTRPNSKRSAKYLYSGTMDAVIKPATYAGAGAGVSRAARVPAATDTKQLDQPEAQQVGPDGLPLMPTIDPLAQRADEGRRAWACRVYDHYRFQGRPHDCPLEIRRLATPQGFSRAGRGILVDR